MSTKNRPSFTKRQKEQARQLNQKKKTERREQRKIERATRPEGETEDDPDIAGIVPGPQPIISDEHESRNDEAQD
jgi:hypothetical protein